jgi:hypothetical protein
MVGTYKKNTQKNIKLKNAIQTLSTLHKTLLVVYMKNIISSFPLQLFSKL